MGTDIISLLIRRLLEAGVRRSSIDKLLSGQPVRDEVEAFIVLDETRRLNPRILLEREYGGLDTEPVYATILGLGDKLVVYLASPMEHEVRLLDNTMYAEAIWIVDEFIKRNT